MMFCMVGQVRMYPDAGSPSSDISLRRGLWEGYRYALSALRGLQGPTLLMSSGMTSPSSPCGLVRAFEAKNSTGFALSTSTKSNGIVPMYYSALYRLSCVAL